MSGRTNEPMNRLDHMNGNSNRARLIRDRSRNRLSNPPCRVRREFVTPTPLEFIDGLHQPDVALLDQVQELKSAVVVLFGNRDHEAKIRFDQLTLGVLCADRRRVYDIEHALEFVQAKA